jgi:hypothetical protein
VWATANARATCIGGIRVFLTDCRAAAFHLRTALLPGWAVATSGTNQLASAHKAAAVARRIISSGPVTVLGRPAGCKIVTGGRDAGVNENRPQVRVLV